MTTGLKLLSILWLMNLIATNNGLPAENRRNSHTSINSDESRHFPAYDSGFVPIIPSQVDPHPILTVHSDPQAAINPIYAEQKYFSSYFRNGHHQMSTSRPFSLRHISSSSSIGSTLATRYTTSSTSPPFDSSILGSGDFTVMRGGTFYPEGREENDNDYFGDVSGTTYYDSNTGRPFALPLERRKRPHYSDNPFADFKDFADITAGVDSDFSHLVVVYANKNSTKHEPRNILEILEKVDEKNHETEVLEAIAPIKSTKLSKFKTKLRRTKLNKEYKKVQIPKKRAETSPIDYMNIDPLVAES